MLQDFGKRLRNLRLKKGYKQSQLGDILNISASAVGMYERGQRQPSVDLILKLSKVFSVSADYLLGTAKSPASVEEILKQIYNSLSTASGLTFNGVIFDEDDIKKFFNTTNVIANVILRDKEHSESLY